MCVWKVENKSKKRPGLAHFFIKKVTMYFQIKVCSKSNSFCVLSLSLFLVVVATSFWHYRWRLKQPSLHPDPILSSLHPDPLGVGFEQRNVCETRKRTFGCNNTFRAEKSVKSWNECQNGKMTFNRQPKGQ